jgi:hypothetical protein
MLGETLGKIFEHGRLTDARLALEKKGYFTTDRRHQLNGFGMVNGCSERNSRHNLKPHSKINTKKCVTLLHHRKTRTNKERVKNR